MDQKDFKTPHTTRPATTRTSSRLAASGLLRPSATTGTPSGSSLKRDSLQAELERDPQLSTSKRLAHSQAFKSTTSVAALERQLAILKTANGELEKKLRDKEATVDQLERDRRWLVDREKEEKEAREEERKQWEEEKTSTSNTLRFLRNQLSSLNSDYAELQDAHSNLSHRTSSIISSLKTQLATLSSQCSSFQAESTASRESEARKDAKIAELQEALASASTAISTSSATSKEEDKMLTEELAKLSDHLRKLESKNTKLSSELVILRSRRDKVEVLREEKRDLERKLEVMESMRNKVGQLELELEESRREREKLSKAPPSSPSVSQTKELTSLRFSHAQLLEEHGTTTAALRQREAEVALLTKREAELSDTIEGFKEQMKMKEEEKGKREVKLRIMEREVKHLRDLVASFTKEQANALEEYAEDDKEEDGATSSQFDAFQAATARVKHLEGLLEQLKVANDDLLKEMKARSGGRAPANDDVLEELEKTKKEKEAVQKDLETAQAELAESITRIDSLEQELFELSGEIAGGRHVPPKTRVLQLADNPEQRWFDLRQEVVDRLKGENEALLRRLREVDTRLLQHQPGDESMEVEGQGANEDLVPRESYELVANEKKELEDEVKKKEKRLLRLQQVYSSKTAEFREAIASILGVKLAFYPNGQVRVTSLYDLSASFVFKPLSGPTSDESGMKMQLIAQGEGGPEDLPSMMHYWVETERCIPGFLASVTLECYDKMKREGGLDS